MKQKRLPLDRVFETRCNNEKCIVKEYKFDFFVISYRDTSREGDKITLTSSCPLCDEICCVEYDGYRLEIETLRNYTRIVGRSQEGRCEGCGATPAGEDAQEENNECSFITLCENHINYELYLMCPDCLIENDETMMQEIYGNDSALRE